MSDREGRGSTSVQRDGPEEQDGDPTAERLRKRLVKEWRWGRMPWAGMWSESGARRWERLLRDERSRRYRLASLVAFMPRLREVLRIPADLATEDDRSVEARERRITDAESSVIGRLARRLRPPADTNLGLRSNPERPKNFPRMGPLLDREIDSALELLRAVPFEELQWRGWHHQPNHFATPLNDLRFLRSHPELWIRSSTPAGIEWDLDGQVALLQTLQPYIAELEDVPDDSDGSGRFHWSNGHFPRGDASVYYGLVRNLKPRRAVEVGAGWSTLMLKRALQANADKCEVIVIEPAPMGEVLDGLPSGWPLHEHPVQLEDASTFEALGPGDVLFYDGSHCVRTASDVNWVFFEVLPRLAPGVWIHVHDIMWPHDYPTHWILDSGLSWNEQYLVQAFLMGNSSYRVRIAVRMLAELRPAEVEAVVPSGFPGASLWFEKVSG